MKILHCCLSAFYIDKYSYQENELVREHIKSGHDVLVLASTETFDRNQNKTYTEPGEYTGYEGAKVIRVPFARWLPFSIMKKVKAYPKVTTYLTSFQPDVIMFHGISSLELLTVAKYQKKHPNVLFYADNHADKHNSGRGFFSKYLLHKLIYRWAIKFSLPQIDKILCISLESQNFCSEIYSIPDKKLEFYPLGGNVFSDEEYISRRKQLRQEHCLNDADILFLQTGKFDKRKKLVDSLNSFLATQNPNFKFFISGSFLEDVEQEVMPLIESDERIVFLGWNDSEVIKSLLCAADVYVQPGTQSATMQMSLCARCPVILDDVESHRIFIDKNGWLVSNRFELQRVFLAIEEDPSFLECMSNNSYSLAQEILDYKKLANRILI